MHCYCNDSPAIGRPNGRPKRRTHTQFYPLIASAYCAKYEKQCRLCELAIYAVRSLTSAFAWGAEAGRSGAILWTRLAAFETLCHAEAYAGRVATFARVLSA